MSVATTIAALQTKHLAISGINSAPTAMPANLEKVRLPCVLIWPGDASWDLGAVGLKRQERMYIVRTYVQKVGSGIAGIDPGYQACIDLIDDFGDAYLSDLGLSNTVDTMITIIDSGVSGGSFELTWGEVPYWGFVYRLTIVEKST